jgi:putative transposase
MSYVKIWVHLVWGTKNREPLLEKTIRPQLFEHIRENARSKEIYIDFINGMPDHVHCLFALNAEMPVAKAVQLIKGESAFWVNKQNLINGKLEWGHEYFAASVSESQIDKVRNYIKNQEEHHRKISFVEEFEAFIAKHKLERQG